MSDGFTKLYGQQLMDSTLWLECWQARLVFIGMLAVANQHGRVECPSVKVLARKLNLQIEDVEAGLAVLEAPDPDSRSPEEEGRRLVREGAGWRIVNHRKYRDFRTVPQERARARASRYRASKRDIVTPNRDASRPSRSVTPRHALDLDLDLSSSSLSSLSSLSLLSEKSTDRAKPEAPLPVWQDPSRPESGWTAEAQRIAFARAFEAAQGTIANMGGKQVGTFHADVVRTAELQKTDPAALFASVLQRWLAKGLTGAERRYPYACFQSAWGDLTAKGETSLGAPLAAPQSASSVRAEAREALMRGDMDEVKRLNRLAAELEDAEEKRGRRGR